MKICVAQTKSHKGNIKINIQNHLNYIESASKYDADLIVFPELSITSYEPNLAEQLAANLEDKVFDVFQVASEKFQMVICVGMPLKTVDGITISMLVFQPNQPRISYAKQMLHEDELPFFVEGKEQVYLDVKGKKIAIGICYETLQKQHVENAISNGANFYLASVAKSKSGIEKVNNYFRSIANQYSTPILMSNSVGFCDNFLSYGNSGVWSKKGKLLAQLNENNEGFIVFDTDKNEVEINQTNIVKGDIEDVDTIFQIYRNAKKSLDEKGIFQWTDNYPRKEIVARDLLNDDLYVLENHGEIIGAVAVNEEQDTEYGSINWEFDNAKVLVIHRLVVNPKHQRKGFAKTLMDFAEKFAKDNRYTSIRLDAYSANQTIVNFYKKRDYFIRGTVTFPQREYPFYCMEKKLDD